MNRCFDGRSVAKSSADHSIERNHLRASTQTTANLSLMHDTPSLTNNTTMPVDWESPMHHANNAPSSWTLPSIFGGNGKALTTTGPGLYSIPTETLERSLEPIMDGLSVLDAEQLLQLERVASGGAEVDRGTQVRPIHDSIQPPTRPEQGNVVRYIHLSEVPDQYSMGIFIFPPHAKIPLHDHPGMCVLSRVLYGELHRLSLDLPKDIKPAKDSSWSPWSHSWAGPDKTQPQKGDISKQPFGAKLAYKHKIDFLQAPDCTCLYPYEGNLHEFVAGPNGAAVLDVLLPPYDGEHDRDCTFYEIHDIEEYDELVPRKEAAIQPCWIVPTGQPEDFHCLSGQYKDMGTAGS